MVGLQAAKVFLDYTENDNEKTLLEVRKGVVNAYGSVLLAQELVGIYEKNKTNIEKNLYETKAIYENGLTEEENVEQLEITFLYVITNLDNAKRVLSIAKQMFNASLGIPVNAKVTLTEALSDLVSGSIQLDHDEREFNYWKIMSTIKSPLISQSNAILN